MFTCLSTSLQASSSLYAPDRVPSNDPWNDCETHFGTSPFSPVQSQSLGPIWLMVMELCLFPELFVFLYSGFSWNWGRRVSQPSLRAWFQRCHVRHQTNLRRKRGQAATELRTHYARNTKDPGVLSAVQRSSLDSLNVLLTAHEITGNWLLERP